VLRLCTSRQRVSSTTLREIEQVLTFYDLDPWQLVGSLLGGRNSYNFLLKTNRGQKVLKKYDRPLFTILKEHSILCHLEATDFPCSRLTLNRDGKTCTELNGERYAVYDFIRGFRYNDYYMPVGLRHRFIAKIGETLARFHQLMDDFVLEGRQIDRFTLDGERLWGDTAWHLDILEQYVRGIRGDSPNALGLLVLRNLDKLRRGLAELGSWQEQVHPQWPELVIHGDYVVENIILDSQGLMGVLDLGSAGLGLRMLDVTLALQSFARRERHGLDASRARSFLDAYQARVSLSDGEVALIPKLSRWRLLRILVRRLREEDVPLSRRLSSFRNRWAKANWLERNGEAFLDALLAPRDHPRL